MLRDSRKSKQKTLVLIGIATVICVVGITLFMSRQAPDSTGSPSLENGKTVGSGNGAGTGTGDSNTPDNTVVTGEIPTPKTIDYKDLDKNEELKTMMVDRKKSLGIKKSLDMIVKSDESFTVGESTVSMQKILEKAFAEEGKVYQEEITDEGFTKPTRIKEYGVYVVQPGDNLWNIHFRILRDYYASRGIPVQEQADEPGNAGMSSGVGKILKFSETMVIIYNLLEERVTQDINLIDPLSKVVVYNMEAVFNLLDEINFTNVDRLQFDGKNIWIPAKKS
ncbi:MAG: hypothetical protein MI802_16435 [Desulfobacterales bacterium]|nr:hypothetical protein [Desulfobacterales bacterium]